MKKPYEGASLEFATVLKSPLENARVDTHGAPSRATTRKLKLLTVALLSGIAWAPAIVAQYYAPPGYGSGPGAYGSNYGPNYGRGAANTGTGSPGTPQASASPTAQPTLPTPTAQATPSKAEAGERGQQPARQGEAFKADQSTTVAIDVPDPVVTVNQSDPTVRVKQSQAQVDVDPGRPQITVHQPAPQVSVRMPQPIITINMPQPQILVEMPAPAVSARVPQPQVSVDQPAPTVTVTQGKPTVRIGSDENQRPSQPEVRVQQGQAQVIMGDAQQAAVTVSEATPQVRYDAAKPVVQVVSEGEPQVQFSQSGEASVQIRQQGIDEPRVTAEQQSAPEPRDPRAQSGQAAPPPVAGNRGNRDDANTAVSARSTRDMQITVGKITDYAIVDIHGKSLGDIDKVVKVDNRLYAVTDTGGFLGFGQKPVAIALSSLVLSNDALQSQGDSPEQIETLDGFQPDAHLALQANYPVTIGRK